MKPHNITIKFNGDINLPEEIAHTGDWLETISYMKKTFVIKDRNSALEAFNFYMGCTSPITEIGQIAWALKPFIPGYLKILNAAFEKANLSIRTVYRGMAKTNAKTNAYTTEVLEF